MVTDIMHSVSRRPKGLEKSYLCFSIPPENIRKTLGFLMFSGGIEKQHLQTFRITFKKIKKPVISCELPNQLRLRILEIYKILAKPQNWVQPGAWCSVTLPKMRIWQTELENSKNQLLNFLYYSYFIWFRNLDSRYFEEDCLREKISS